MKKLYRLISFNIFLIFFLLIFFPIFNVNAKEPYINGKFAIAMDSKSKVVMYEKNSDYLVPIASTTKIMTSLVAIKYGNLDKKIEISKKAASINESKVGYKKGEMISLEELLYGLMLRSGNDAAIAIAEGISGSVEEFSKLMNEFALQLGLSNSHFESPHGLDSENHYSTAYELAYLTCLAKENDVFNEIVSSKDVDAREKGFSRNYHNINKILWQIPSANGVKTGYTSKAGKCLVTSVDVDGNDIVIVVLDCTPRWKETTKIYDYVLKNYEFKKFYSKGEKIDEVKTKKGNKKVDLICSEDIIIPVKKDNNYTTKVIKPEYIQEVNAKDDVGTFAIYKDEDLIYSCNLCVNNSYKFMERFDKFKNLFDK